MIELLAVKVPPSIDQNDYSLLLSSISEDERIIIESFQSSHDAYRSLLAKVLVRFQVSQLFNVSINGIKICSNNYGKPLLENIPYYFNVSHSYEWVVCVFDDKPIGVDIEKVQSVNHLKIAKRFFNEQEYIDLNKVSPNQQLEYFYKLWTLKESYVKQVGMGLKLPLNSFCIREVKPDCFEIQDDRTYMLSVTYFHQYNDIPQYCVSVCASELIFPENIKFIDIEILKSNIKESSVTNNITSEN